MAITDENEVRILVKQEPAAQDLARAIAAGDNKIVAITNRELSEWSPDDNAYGQLQSIGSLYAAWVILMGWDPKMYLEKAKEIRKAYDYEVEQFKKMALPDNKANPDVAVAESEYTHYKLNPNERPFLSTY